MDFMKQLAKGLVVLTIVDLGMVVFGISPESARFRVVSALVGFGATFSFLYDYMDFVGIMNSLGTPGLDSSQATSATVWKFLGVVCFVIAAICLVAW
ncbi:hypothetical protein [Dyella sp. A6]|uniref:hypothetical protein n=1 Tax=Dyella aluminiiresistens TaxID=3069105 RepID=UPI002E762B68|nr:hypothetical protein [Dyella sp. A6]